jgi:hypothetical protein
MAAPSTPSVAAAAAPPAAAPASEPAADPRSALLAMIAKRRLA